MSGKYRSVFDIIGPTMIGPSSSHTAGAVAIGAKARQIFGAPMKQVRIDYYESFAMTHKGHGTDYALAAGVLGMAPDDERVPNAIEVAQEQGVLVEFIEHQGPSPIDHPNTAILTVKNDQKEIKIAGCSVGGGTIELREMEIEGQLINPTGPLPMMMVWLSERSVFDQLVVLLAKNQIDLLGFQTVTLPNDRFLVVLETNKQPTDELFAQMEKLSERLVCL